MAILAGQLGTHSTFPASSVIVLVIVLLAAGYGGGRQYLNRRHWR